MIRILLALLLAFSNVFYLEADARQRKDKKPPKLLEMSFSESLSINEANLNLPVSIKLKDPSGIKNVVAKFVYKKPKKKKKSKNKNLEIRARKLNPNSSTDKVISTEAISINEDLEEHILNIPFTTDKNLGDWFLVIKVEDNKGNKKVFNTKKFKKLRINNKLILNDDPVMEDEPDIDTDDLDETPTEDPVEEGPTPTPPAPTPSPAPAPAPTPTPTPTPSPPPPSNEIIADPPNSMLQAPALNPNQGSAIDNLDFLLAGSNPMQTNVSPGAIDETRQSIIRGKVYDTNMQPLNNVVVTVHKHSELGRTHTMSNGEFNMVVNGGGILTVTFNASGYLPVQRTINVRARDFFVLDDICLSRLDSSMTTVDLNSSSGIQVAESSMTNDVDGERHVMMMFKPNTHAMMTMPDGSQQALSQADIRATEYTVGENGPLAMPGSLPATSGYTYAVELSADEAIAAGAMEVKFDKPVSFYVDNYLNFPVGENVPMGYYDKEKAAWIASDDGRIIEIIDIQSAKALVDISGDGQANTDAELIALGFDDLELVKLAQMYPIGKSLWRVPVPHFTPWDCNWPYGPPGDAEPPPSEPPEDEDGPEPDEPDQCEGSIIYCQNQALGERIPITGTGYFLNYKSDKVKDRRGKRSITFQVTKNSLPASLKDIEVEITIAGRKIRKSFAPELNKKLTYIWDGLDIYGREIFGEAVVQVKISYIYDLVYYRSSYGSQQDFQRSFARINSDDPSNPVRFLGRRDTRDVKIQRAFEQYLSNFSIKEVLGIGGWSINENHLYNSLSRKLFLGNGSVRTSQSVPEIIETVAGGDFTVPGHFFLSPEDIEVDSKGNIIILGGHHSNIYKLTPEGVLTKIAGQNTCFTSGENIPAINACLWDPQGIAVGPDDSIYIAERVSRIDSNDSNKIIGNRIKKIGADGIIRTIAGTGESGFSGDGGPALQAKLHFPHDVTIGPDGAIYISDTLNGAIRKVDQDGIITTVVGSNNFSSTIIDDVPATQFKLRSPHEIAFDRFGNMLITTSGRIRKVSPDGIITTIAGNGFSLQEEGDGGLALDAKFRNLDEIAIGKNGTIYTSGIGNHTVRAVDILGVIRRFAGTGNFGFSGEGSPAVKAMFGFNQGLAIDNNGDLLIGDSNNRRIRKIKLNLLGFSGSSLVIPDESGEKYFEFNKNGKHLATYNAKTNEKILEFGYDADDFLISITDAGGNITSIERTGKDISAIVAPDGQRTEITLDNNGYIATVTNPANEAFSMTYTADGLLTSFTNPRNNSSTFEYGNFGRLRKDTNAINGFQSLDRTKLANGYEVNKTTALGRNINFKVEVVDDGDLKLTNTLPDGRVNIRLDETSGDDVITRADGTVVNRELGPDPRFFMLAPIIKNQTTVLPSGLTNTLSVSKTAELNDPRNKLDLKRETETTDINGRSFVSDYDAATRTFTKTSAANRIINEVIDNKGRLVERHPAGLESSFFTYDNRGRLTEIKVGTGLDERLTAFSYGPDGFINQITDAEAQTIDFTRDLVGRITKQTFSPNQEVNFTFDGNDNLTSLSPPGKGPHAFNLNPVDLLEKYSPPGINGGNSPETDYSYNLDKQLTQIARPDGKNIDFNYGSSTGLLNSITIPRGTISMVYDPSSAQLTQLTAPGNEALNFTYDGFLQTSETSTGTINADVDTTYDNNFFVASRDVKDSNLIAFTYDADGLLTQAGDLSISLNPQNALITGATLDNTNTSYSYNAFSEPTNYIAKFNASDLYNVDYTRDKLGRITQKIETIQGVTKTTDYEYDAERRLNKVFENGVLVREYSYDQNDNRVSLNTTTATYDEQDRLVQYGTNTYQYNANGDLTAKFANLQSTTYNYDALGNLITAGLPNGDQIEYVIDGKNRRVGKKINSTLTQGFVYKDQLEPIAELDAAGNVVSRFVYGTKPHVPDYMIKNGVKYLFVTDNVGSVRLVVDSTTGTVAQRIDYDEFGNVTQDTNPGFQPFGFAGGLYDRDTKLVRFGARDYDPETGRWTAKDPIRFSGQQTNLYSYLESDPINLIDITGNGYFGKGPLNGFPGTYTNPIDDLTNTELAHEQFFFDDGNNAGFFPSKDSNGLSKVCGGKGEVRPLDSDEGYTKSGPYYDDDIIREAIEKVGEPNYCLLGSNCQSWADGVREEYGKIVDGQ